MVDIGCGVGFLGILCAMLDAKKVVLTDGNTDVLTMAKENIGYSKNAPLVVRRYSSHVASDLTELNSLFMRVDSVTCPTTASLLDWENFAEEQIAALDAEVLILSDLVLWRTLLCDIRFA